MLDCTEIKFFENNCFKFTFIQLTILYDVKFLSNIACKLDLSSPVICVSYNAEQKLVPCWTSQDFLLQE